MGGLLERSYKEENTWIFPKKELITNLNFEPLLKQFKENGANGFVREIIQNSLDASDKSVDGPVIVRFTKGKVNSSQIPGLDSVFNVINNIEAGNDYDKKTISDMKMLIKEDKIEYFCAEDENTTGLSKEILPKFAITTGYHAVHEDSDTEKIRGGSHGVGKMAANAVSLIHMMMFANNDGNTESVGGSVLLIDHEINGNKFSGTGFFTDSSKGDFKPVVNNYKGIFEKKSRGLKVIVPFFDNEINIQEDILKEVYENFFVAIIEKKLKVYIEEFEISDNNILEIHKKYIDNDNFSLFTKYYVESYFNSEPIKLIVEDKNRDKYNFNMYFRYVDVVYTYGH